MKETNFLIIKSGAFHSKNKVCKIKSFAGFQSVCLEKENDVKPWNQVISFKMTFARWLSSLNLSVQEVITTQQICVRLYQGDWNLIFRGETITLGSPAASLSSIKLLIFKSPKGRCTDTYKNGLIFLMRSTPPLKADALHGETLRLAGKANISGWVV